MSYKTPRTEEVIITHVMRGKGVEGDPCRRVLQIHRKNGDFLAERDDLHDEMIEEMNSNKKEKL